MAYTVAALQALANANPSRKRKNAKRTRPFVICGAELCTLVSFAVIIGGGVQRRAAGWQVASGVLLFSAVVQCGGMAIVVRPLPLSTTPFPLLPFSELVTDCLGLPLRPRLPLLGRLAPRHVLPPRHRLLDHPRPHIRRHHCLSPLPPKRRRLRAHPRRANGA
jgi:hypothetical protein